MTGMINSLGSRMFIYWSNVFLTFSHLQILSLEWSRGIESLKCVSRIDLSLHGSFADMVLLPSAGVKGDNETLLLILTNPGQLHVYDKACLSALTSQLKNTSVRTVKYTTIVPTIEPNLTVSKLSSVHRDGEFSRSLSKVLFSR